MNASANPFTNGRIVGKHVAPSEYHAYGANIERGDPGFVMSNGNLVAFSRNPAKWRRGVAVVEKTWAMDFGSWFDCQLLTPDLADRFFAVTPLTYPADGRKGEPPLNKAWNRNATFCRDWEEEQEAAGKQVISYKIGHAVRNALAWVTDDAEVKSLVDGSDHQVWCQADYRDSDTGRVVPVKVLLDIVPHDGNELLDLKTTADGHPSKWRDTVFHNGYHVQAALYRDVFNAATGEDRIEFSHLVIENEPPFHVVKPLMELSKEFLELGTTAYRRAFTTYCRCLETNEWPSYDPPAGTLVYQGRQFVSPKPWMQSE